jgi:hypothetical protein
LQPFAGERCGLAQVVHFRGQFELGFLGIQNAYQRFHASGQEVGEHCAGLVGVVCSHTSGIASQHTVHNLSGRRLQVTQTSVLDLFLALE